MNSAESRISERANLRVGKGFGRAPRRRSRGSADDAGRKSLPRHLIGPGIDARHRGAMAELADHMSERTPCARMLASVIGGQR
jgi:hypothetical protein